ncbi:MAG: hypothetical protein CMI57_02490, partial [Parcubacteria group bacterium]|nr:hypothetical protein [Parcubacteria group bacterium]
MNIVTIYAFGSVIIVSLISLIGVFALSLNQKFLNKSVFLLVSLAVGALFGDAIIHLIPEAFEGIANPASASLLILSGILTFLVLEKFLRWRHAHGHECDTQECQHGIAAQDIKTKPVGSLIVASDSVHNLVDG